MPSRYGLQRLPDLAVRRQRQALFRDGRPADIPTQPSELLPLIRPRCYARLQRESRCLAEPVIEGLPAQLRAGDLLVFNDTRATGVRLFGRKATGGTGRDSGGSAARRARTARAARCLEDAKAGAVVHLEGDSVELGVHEREADLFRLRLWSDEPLIGVLERVRRLPLAHPTLHMRPARRTARAIRRCSRTTRALLQLRPRGCASRSRCLWLLPMRHWDCNASAQRPDRRRRASR